MASTSTRVKPPVRPLIESKDEANQKVARIGELQRKQAALKQETDDQVQAIVETAASEHAELQRQINELAADLQAYASYNRDDLTHHGKTKTVKLANGSLSWRFTPWKVTIKGVDAVILALRKLGLDQFLNVKVTINKEAMLKQRTLAEAVDGVSFSQQEEFIIKPNETDLEIAQTVKPPAK